jgi:1-acyl-sn-glycerol-3-phosphate acyltransferase
MFQELTIIMVSLFKIFLIFRFIFLFISTLLFTILAGLTFWTKYFNLNIDYYLMLLWSRSLRFIYGIKLIKKHYLGEIGIYVSPHSSFWDIIILSEIKGFFVSKKEVLKWPVIGIGARMVRTIFIEREKGVSAINSMKKKALNVFKTNNSIIVFPEGTRSYEHMNDLKLGAFHIAYSTNFPIIPVILRYEPKDPIISKAKTSFIKELFFQSLNLKRQSVKLEFLPPIKPEDFNSARELKDHVLSIMDKSYNF